MRVQPWVMLVLVAAAVAAGSVCGLPAALAASHAETEAGHGAAPGADLAAGPGAETEAGHSEAAAAGHGEDHPPELPSLVHLLHKAFTRPAAPGAPPVAAPPWLRVLYRFQDVFYALLAALVIIVVARIGSRRMQPIPGRAQNVVEAFVDGFRTFILDILGPSGEPYVPFLGTLFLYIWFMNLFGLIPLMRSPTSALSTTAALAICVFLYVQWIGMRRLGPLRYLRHLAGDPQDVVGWAMVPLMLPLHVISEIARPVSLSLRLFGNILGEDVLIGVFAGLGIAVLAFLHLPFGLPLHLPFILLALLMSTVQALVFTLLSTIYIMQVLPHEEHAGEKPAPAGRRGEARRSDPIPIR
ncbi:MAG: F0F1 ATP synthase subunit A [Candidatus Eisenbacteria bacterium]